MLHEWDRRKPAEGSMASIRGRREDGDAGITALNANEGHARCFTCITSFNPHVSCDVGITNHNLFMRSWHKERPANFPRSQR